MSSAMISAATAVSVAPTSVTAVVLPNQTKRQLSVKETNDYVRLKGILLDWANQGKANTLKDLNAKKRFRDLQLVCEHFAEDILDPKMKEHFSVFECCSSVDNVVQGIALTNIVRPTVQNPNEMLPGYLKIFWIVTNPHNIRSKINDSNKSKVKGTGTILIAHLAKACINNNFKGMAASLSATATDFFEKMKFRKDQKTVTFDYRISREEILKWAESNVKPYSLTYKQFAASSTGSTALTAAGIPKADSIPSQQKTADAQLGKIKRTLLVCETNKINYGSIKKILETWKGQACNKASQCNGEDFFQFQSLASMSNFFVSELISSGISYFNLFECRSNDDVVQALALTNILGNSPAEIDGEKCRQYTVLKGYLKIFFIVTNPHNIRSKANENAKAKIKGAGTALIGHLAKYCLQHNLKGLLAESSITSIEFWEKMHFKPLKVTGADKVGAFAYHVTPEEIKRLAESNVKPYALTCKQYAVPSTGPAALTAAVIPKADIISALPAQQKIADAQLGKIKRTVSVGVTKLIDSSIIQKILSGWRKDAKGKAVQCDGGEREQFSDVSSMSLYFKDKMEHPEVFQCRSARVYQCRSSDNVVQALALTRILGTSPFNDEKDRKKYAQLKDHLEIISIVTNPHNVRSKLNEGDPEKIKGSGTALIGHLAKICLRDNLKGLFADSLSSSKIFWEKMKFKPQKYVGDDVYPYLLTSDEIRSLAAAEVKPFSQTCKQAASSNSTK